MKMHVAKVTMRCKTHGHHYICVISADEITAFAAQAVRHALKAEGRTADCATGTANIDPERLPFEIRVALGWPLHGQRVFDIEDDELPF